MSWWEGGARLSRLIKNSGETNEALAESFGVSASLVSYWRSGARIPTTAMLGPICRKFGCSADWLIGLSAQEVSEGEAARTETLAVAFSESLVAAIERLVRERLAAFSRSLDADPSISAEDADRLLAEGLKIEPRAPVEPRRRKRRGRAG